MLSSYLQRLLFPHVFFWLLMLILYAGLDLSQQHNSVWAWLGFLGGWLVIWAVTWQLVAGDLPHLLKSGAQALEDKELAGVIGFFAVLGGFVSFIPSAILKDQGWWQATLGAVILDTPPLLIALFGLYGKFRQRDRELQRESARQTLRRRFRKDAQWLAGTMDQDKLESFLQADLNEDVSAEECWRRVRDLLEQMEETVNHQKQREADQQRQRQAQRRQLEIIQRQIREAEAQIRQLQTSADVEISALMTQEIEAKLNRLHYERDQLLLTDEGD